MGAEAGAVTDSTRAVPLRVPIWGSLNHDGLRLVEAMSKTALREGIAVDAPSAPAAGLQRRKLFERVDWITFLKGTAFFNRAR
jgi:hypothetical protein